MKRIVFVVLMLFLAVDLPAAASAQVTQADSAAVLLGVATRLRAEGRTTLANSLLDLIIERWANTPAANEARTLLLEVNNVQEERSGKTELLVWSTTYGLALGVLTPVAFGSESPEVYGLGLIAGGPAGYLLGRSILKDRPVSEGQARAMTFGSIWGAWQTFGWSHVFGWADREECFADQCFADDANGELLLRAALLGSAVGFGSGVYLARKDIPAGTATAVSLGALWGTWYGTALHILLSDDGSSEDRGWALALLGGNAGLVTTAILAPKMQLSRARARLISISGVAGLLAGFGVLLITQPDDIGSGAILVPASTSALGLVLGTAWTRDYDERSQSPGRDDEGALLEWNRSFKLGTPELSLRALEIRRNGRPAYEPGLSVPLFRAKF